MLDRLSLVPLAACAWLLATAPAALAEEAPDNGEGILGETDDRVVTFFSLGVILFFLAVVVVGTLVQQRLERRKEEQKAAAMRRRIGW